MEELVRQVNIMYGLPGSGKTFFCLSNAGRTEGYVDLDALVGEMNAGVEPAVQLGGGFITEKIKHCGFPVIWVDGLITTHKVLQSVAKSVVAGLKGPSFKIEISVHVWKEDRESCLYNDNGRREKSCKASIKYLPYEEVDEENIREITGLDEEEVQKIGCVYHEVVRKPEYRRWFENHGLDIPPVNAPAGDSIRNLWPRPTNRVYSKKWCKGGTARDYLGTTTYIDAEPQPEFTELLHLLYQIDEDIPYRVVVEILKKVKAEEKRVPDYYGGCITMARLYIELEDIYEEIKKYM